MQNRYVLVHNLFNLHLIGISNWTWGQPCILHNYSSVRGNSVMDIPKTQRFVVSSGSYTFSENSGCFWHTCKSFSKNYTYILSNLASSCCSLACVLNSFAKRYQIADNLKNSLKVKSWPSWSLFFTLFSIPTVLLSSDFGYMRTLEVRVCHFFFYPNLRFLQQISSCYCVLPIWSRRKYSNSDRKIKDKWILSKSGQDLHERIIQLC